MVIVGAGGGSGVGSTIGSVGSVDCGCGYGIGASQLHTVNLYLLQFPQIASAHTEHGMAGLTSQLMHHTCPGCMWGFAFGSGTSDVFFGPIGSSVQVATGHFFGFQDCDGGASLPASATFFRLNLFVRDSCSV